MCHLAYSRRIDAFELCCWRRLLRVTWTARSSNQSILKDISPGCSLEGLMLIWNSNTLATSCKELAHWKRLWWWEGLGAGGEGDDRGWDGWMASLTQWPWVRVNSGSWWWTWRPGVLWFMGSQRVGRDWGTELNWMYYNWLYNEAQDLMEVKFPVIFGLISSSPFMLYLVILNGCVILLMIVPCPFPPVS